MDYTYDDLDILYQDEDTPEFEEINLEEVLNDIDN